MVDGISSNMPSNSDENKKVSTNQGESTKEDASIFSTYDDNKDGVISYKDDASAKSYLNAPKYDYVRFDSNYNQDERIKAAVNELDNVWDGAMEDISFSYKKGTDQEEVDTAVSLEMYKESMKREKNINAKVAEIEQKIEDTKKLIDEEKALETEKEPEVEEEPVQEEQPQPVRRRTKTKVRKSKIRKTTAQKKQSTSDNTVKPKQEKYYQTKEKSDATNIPQPKPLDLSRMNSGPTLKGQIYMSYARANGIIK